MKIKRFSLKGAANWRCAFCLFFLFGALPTVLEAGSFTPAESVSVAERGSATMHLTRSIADAPGVKRSIQRSPADDAALNAPAVPFTDFPPTRSSFLAVWEAVDGANGYRIDVSMSRSFESCVVGYHNLDVGKVTTRIVFGLEPGTTYYFRTRAYGSSETEQYSETKSVTTPLGSGVVINPTFDSSITGAPNAAAIQSMINQAVAVYQALFSDQVTVTILFRYSTTDPISGDPIGGLGQSYSWGFVFPWSTVINALLADAKTTRDATANASLPGSPLTTNMRVNSALGRALGMNTPGGLMIGGQGPFDGVVTLVSSQPLQFTRPPSPSNYDALRTTEHEIDEVLGLGSFLNQGAQDIQGQDLFSWSAPGVRNTTTTGSRYFSINSGNNNIVGFNQTAGGDFGDWISPSCPQPNPYVQNAFSCPGQVDDVTASSPEGINLDVVGYDLQTGVPTPTPAPTPTPGGNTVLGNLSTRLLVQTGDNALIGGIIVTGTQAKSVILRAIGPSLPLGGALGDPTLELRDSAGNLLAFNDDWKVRPDGSSQQAEVEATGIPPTNNFESALVGTLAANNAAYTLIVRGYNNTTGIGVVEAYDLNRSVDSKMANISTRGFVNTGNDVMIGGTIILGSASANVLFRAIGPSLAPLGVPNAMADTILELRDSNGGLIAINDDWRMRPDGSSQELEIQGTGIPPSHIWESALLQALAPAAYTAIVRGYNNGTGVALVEAYLLQ